MPLAIPTYENFTQCYHDLIREVYTSPDFVCAPRGQPIREKLGVSFKVLDPRNRLPYIPERNYSIAYMLGELLWVMAGSNDIHWIAKYSPFWLGVTDDGQTSSSAPGYRIFKQHPRIDNGSHVQYERILEELKRDRDSRRAVVYLGQPTDHFASKLDVGCVTGTQFFLRENKLYQIVTMRSSDLILGLPYDFGILTMLQEVLAFDLGVELGSIVWHANSEHIYERNFEIAEAVVNADVSVICPSMPTMTSKPPVDFLFEFEKNCWSITSSEDLGAAFKEIELASVDPYWKDWMRVLIGHRAKKIDKTLKKKIYESFEFEGYRRFKK